MTKEHDTVEDVGRDADAEDEGIEVADEDIVYGGESLKGDDVIGVVPRNKVVYVDVDFALSVVDLSLLYRRHLNRLLLRGNVTASLLFYFILFSKSLVNEQTCSHNDPVHS